MRDLSFCSVRVCWDELHDSLYVEINPNPKFIPFLFYSIETFVARRWICFVATFVAVGREGWDASGVVLGEDGGHGEEEEMDDGGGVEEAKEAPVVVLLGICEEMEERHSAPFVVLVFFMVLEISRVWI